MVVCELLTARKLSGGQEGGLFAFTTFNSQKSLLLKKEESSFSHRGDPSGDSIVDAVYFYFDSGDVISAHCSNYEETFRNKNNLSEGISVSIDTVEITSWFSDR